jgi:hypothetical protein
MEPRALLPYMVMAAADDLKLLKRLLKSGADPNLQDTEGRTVSSRQLENMARGRESSTAQPSCCQGCEDGVVCVSPSSWQSVASNLQEQYCSVIIDNTRGPQGAMSPSLYVAFL